MAGCRSVSAQSGGPDLPDDQQPEVEAEFDDESADEAAAREEAALLEQGEPTDATEQSEQVEEAEQVEETEPVEQTEQEAAPPAQARATGGFDLFAPAHAQDP